MHNSQPAKPMKGLAKLVAGVQKIAVSQALISQFIVVVIGIVIAYGVVMRYAFRQGIAWAWELPGLLFLVITAFGLAYTQIQRRHVHVDLLLVKLPRKARNILQAFAHVVFFAFCVILLRATIIKLMRDWVVRTEVARIPMAPLEIVLAIGLVVLMLQLLIDIGKEIAEFSRKPEAG